MILSSSLELYAGGPGSGCNPAVGQCGRVRWFSTGGSAPKKTVAVSQIMNNPFNARVSPKTVAKYLQRMKDGKRVEMPDAYLASNGKYVLVDGHHRTAAARKFGEKFIRLEVSPKDQVPPQQRKIK